jgi:hypothetical protein
VENDLSILTRSVVEDDEASPFRFLDLPEDVRIIIYGILYTWERDIPIQELWWHKSPPSDYVTKISKHYFLKSGIPTCSVALLQTCRTVYEEAMRTLYGVNRFKISIGTKDISICGLIDSFYLMRSSDIRRFLKHIHITKPIHFEANLLSKKLPRKLVKFFSSLTRHFPVLIECVVYLHYCHHWNMKTNKYLKSVVSKLKKLTRKERVKGFRIASAAFIDRSSMPEAGRIRHEPLFQVRFIRKGYTPRGELPEQVLTEEKGWTVREKTFKKIPCHIFQGWEPYFTRDRDTERCLDTWKYLT